MSELLASETTLDLVVNATPPPVHEPVTRAALERGIHVYSEKPLAQTYEAAVALSSLSAERDLCLFPAPDTPSSAWLQRLAEIVEAGDLGYIHSAHCRIGEAFTLGRAREQWLLGPNVGVLEDLVVYPLTELTALLGPAVGVFALLTNARPSRVAVDGTMAYAANYDTAHVLLQHATGAVSSIDASSSCGMPDEYVLELRGVNGRAGIRGKRPQSVTMALRDSGGQVRDIPVPEDDWCAGVRYAAHYLSGVGDRPPISISHSLHVTELIERCRDSAATAAYCGLDTSFSVRDVRWVGDGRGE
jgi:predicted dehydrogenase